MRLRILDKVRMKMTSFAAISLPLEQYAVINQDGARKLLERQSNIEKRTVDQKQKRFCKVLKIV